jgi:hypothetical protein
MLTFVPVCLSPTHLVTLSFKKIWIYSYYTPNTLFFYFHRRSISSHREIFFYYKKFATVYRGELRYDNQVIITSSRR